MAVNKEKGDLKRSQIRSKKEEDADDHDLERLAIESLLEDTRRRKSRVNRVGTMGWVKQRQVNKRFLNSVVLQTVSRQTKRTHVCEGKSNRDKEETSEMPRDPSARELNSQGRGVQSRDELFRERERDRDSGSKRRRVEEKRASNSVCEHSRGKRLTSRHNRDTPTHRVKERHFRYSTSEMTHNSTSADA